MKHWNIAYGKDGFSFHAYESRKIGMFASWLVEQDPCWWGEYKNLPFCLINPWGWTWKVGPEGRTLGDAWSAFGQWCHQAAWRLERSQRLLVVPLSDEDAQRIDPEFYADMKALDLDDGVDNSATEP